MAKNRMGAADEDRLNNAIGLRMKQLREASDHTQESMSRILDTARSTYSLYEAGLRALPIELAIRIATHFGVPLDWLLAGNSQGMSMERIRELGLPQRKAPR